MHLGTFARVWLAKPRRRSERKDQVYALKILRKADGEGDGEILHHFSMVLT